MTYVPQTLIGQELVGLFGVGTDWTELQGNQEHLALYLDAIGALFEQAASIVLDEGVDGDPAYQTGYGSLFTVNPRFDGDTSICPTDELPYLAQYVGVTIPSGADDTTARSLISQEVGVQRGTPTAIVAAAQRYLSGTQSVVNLERTRADGSKSAYAFTLIVRPEEVVSETDLIAAVNAVKPGGVMWILVETDGWTISEMEAAYTSITNLEAAFSSLTRLEADIAG